MAPEVELESKLKLALATVDSIQDHISPGWVRSRERINVMRDQLILLALELGFPVKPLSDASDRRQEPPTG